MLLALLENLIRPQQQCLGNREAERLGGLEIDHQLELPGLLFKNLIRDGAILSVHSEAHFYRGAAGIADE